MPANCLAPYSVAAEDHDWDDKPRQKHHRKANEMAGMGIAAGCSARELLRRNIGSLAKYRQVRTIALALLPFAPAKEESCQHSNATSLAINLLNLATLLREFNAGKGLS